MDGEGQDKKRKRRGTGGWALFSPKVCHGTYELDSGSLQHALEASLAECMLEPCRSLLAMQTVAKQLHSLYDALRMHPTTHITGTVSGHAAQAKMK